MHRERIGKNSYTAIIKALENRNPAALRTAIEDDIPGSAAFVLEALNSLEGSPALATSEMALNP